MSYHGPTICTAEPLYYGEYSSPTSLSFWSYRRECTRLESFSQVQKLRVPREGVLAWGVLSTAKTEGPQRKYFAPGECFPQVQKPRVARGEYSPGVSTGPKTEGPQGKLARGVPTVNFGAAVGSTHKGSARQGSAPSTSTPPSIPQYLEVMGYSSGKCSLHKYSQ